MAESAFEPDSVSKPKRRKANKMTESAVRSDTAPQLPFVVLTKMASMLPRTSVEGWAFKDPLQLAAVNRQLRQAVRSSIQLMKRRHLRINIYGSYANEDHHISVAGIKVKNELRSSYSQMDCIDALLAFGQPNSLHLFLSENGKLLSQQQILMRSLPLSLSSLVLDLRIVDEIGVDLHFDQVLNVVASKTNLETLKIVVRCLDESAAATHKKSSPSVPKDSPFSHLLTLKNLRALRIDARGLLLPAQMADLVNRSQSKITHICMMMFSVKYKMFEALSDVARGNIVSTCCLYLSAFLVDQFLNRLPNCATMHVRLFGSVSREKLSELGGRLLDVCCADDGHPGRTLECDVGCDRHPVQEYVEEGGDIQMEFTRGDAVVHLTIGSYLMMKHKHCPFDNPHDSL